MNFFFTMSFLILLSFPAMLLMRIFLPLWFASVAPFYQATIGLWFLSIVLVVLKHKAK